MAIANTVIQLKKSGVSGNVPSSLNYGELALNYYDGKLYYKNASGTITYIASGSSVNSFATMNVAGSLILATSNTDTLSYTAKNGISISANTTSKTIILDGNIIFSLANTALQNTSNIITAGSLTVSSNLAVANSGSFNSVSSNSINIGIGSIVNMSSNVLTTGSTSQTIIDSFPTSAFRCAKYMVELISGTVYHMIELNVIHDGTTGDIAQYGEVIIGYTLGTFDVNIISETLNLLMTPTNSVTNVRLVRTALTAS
jgi:hypothetical protein